MLERLRKNYLIWTILILQLIGYLWYVKSSTANIVFQDQYDFLQYIDKYFQGSLTFTDLWRSHLEHRTLGYNLLFLGNAIFFHLNTLLEIYLGAIVLLLTGFCLSKVYQRSLEDSSSNTFIQLSFLFLSFIIFSLNQWENIVFSLGMTIMLKSLFFLITWIEFDKVLIKGEKRLWLLGILLAIDILLVGSGYSPALFATMLLAFACKKLLREGGKEDYRQVLWVVVITLILFGLYFYKIYDNNMVQDNTSLTDKLLGLLHDPVGAIKYVLLSLSASVLGVNASTRFIGRDTALVIGLGVLGCYIVAMWMFVKSRMYKKTYLPITLMGYSLLIYAMILLGRFSYGIDYGMSSRYATDTQLGLVGIIWICIHYVRNFRSSNLTKLSKALGVLIIAVILLGQVITNIQELKIAPYRQQHFQNLRAIALDPARRSDKELQLYQYDTTLVKSGLDLLKKYNLNVYYDIGRDMNSGVLGEGWWPKAPAENYRWIGKEAKAVLKSGPEGSLTIAGYVPDVYDTLELKVLNNQNVIGVKTLTKGSFTLQMPVPPNTILNLQLQPNKTFIPKNLGKGNDERELGIIINAIEAK